MKNVHFTIMKHTTQTNGLRYFVKNCKLYKRNIRNFNRQIIDQISISFHNSSNLIKYFAYLNFCTVILPTAAEDIPTAT